MYIPSGEIKQPKLHADTLGFTFVWNGHFLRGIFPQSVTWAKSYFDTGFIDKVVEKGLFPRTWISEFENEQFGMIIEHEIISPILYATDWNSGMLKDAALMVLDIAEVGWQYGYNMVDCHKLNVMFQNNRPVYVDLGSFVPKEKGSTGWKPYINFLESYTYILDMWTCCPQLAKRMMSPGVSLHSEDYWAWKRLLYRKHPDLLRWKLRMNKKMNAIAIMGSMDGGRTKRFLKKTINEVRPFMSQSFSCLRKRIKQMKVSVKPVKNRYNKRLDYDFFDKCNSLTCINISNTQILNVIRQKTEKLISLNENDCNSNFEYFELKNITSVSYPLLNGGILIRDKFPETRLCSEFVFTTYDLSSHGQFAMHNSLVFFEHCITYSKTGKMYIWLPNHCDDLTKTLNEKFSILNCSKDKTLILVEKQR